MSVDEEFIQRLQRLFFETNKMGSWILVLLLAMEFAIGDDRAAQQSLQLHNEYRKLHRAPQLTLDSSLNAAAHKCAEHYARKRKIDHSCKKHNAGENLFSIYGKTRHPSPEVIAADSTNAWYREIQNYNFRYPATKKGVVGHFTQLIWKKSKQLGFAIVYNGTYTVAVALYRPPGNIHRSKSKDPLSLYRSNVLPLSEVESSSTLPSAGNTIILTTILVITPQISTVLNYI